jgi:glycosyltransferase involved in cell wall biosynthesis
MLVVRNGRGIGNSHDVNRLPEDSRTEHATSPKAVDVTVGIPTRNRSRWLREAIESVLAQSYDNFVVIVSDNASTDDTGEVVGSFQDPRVQYAPLEHDIGMTGNLNRLIDLSTTEFLLILCDDDALHPDHLSLTVEALRRWPTAGVAHAGSSIVDGSGSTLNPHVRLMKTNEPVVFDARREFLKRSMVSVATCFSSALFRRAAVIGAGGLREEEEPIADISLMMRIGRDWDFVYLNRPLVVTRAHLGAESAGHGWFTPSAFRWDRSFPDLLYERRRSFLAERGLDEREASKLRRRAERAYRHDRVRYLSTRASTGDSMGASFRNLWTEVRVDYRLAFDPMTWRFVAGQLGGRRLRRVAQRVLAATRNRPSLLRRM